MKKVFVLEFLKKKLYYQINVIFNGGKIFQIIMLGPLH